MIIWILELLSFILLGMLIALTYISFKVIFFKEYRKYPPFVPSFGKEQKIIFGEVSKILQNSPTPLTIVDPGCGVGSLILKLAKKYPNHYFVGIEWSKPVYYICKMRSKKYKNITIINDNLFNYPFDNADIIVCFLMQPLMEDIGKKIIKECKKDVIVFSNSFYISNLNLIKKFETKKKGFIENVYKYNLGL